jgi:hypothetical protein
MTGPLQSQSDRILWMLSESGGKMERGRLRRHMEMRYALLDPILEELARDGKLRMQEENNKAYFKAHAKLDKSVIA